MLSVLVLFCFFAASQVFATKCLTTHQLHYLPCTIYCNITESSNEPSLLEYEGCNLRYTNFDIRFINSKYKVFTLQHIISEDIACYGSLKIGITNSTIDTMSMDGFPKEVTGNRTSCKVTYEQILFKHNLFWNVNITNIPSYIPAKFVDNKWEILGHNVSYSANILDMSDKNILDVKPVFGLFKNIYGLSLAKNRIKTIHQPFVDIPNLINLNLTKNWIEIIDENSFKGLSNLEYLYLAQNKITDIRNAFNNTPKLNTLYLAFNNVKLSSDVFVGLSNLRYLVLSHNHINSIHNAFKTTVKLIVLRLDNNNLTDVNGDIFGQLNDLRELDLYSNQLTWIDNAFQNMNSLQILILSYNNLTQINFNSFIGLNKLQDLDLSHNQISVINHAFIDLTSLEKLNLSYNKIAMCDLNTFTGLSHLTVLDLSHNYLTTLDENFPINIAQLAMLDISFNKLTTLNTAIFHELPRLHFINVDNNNFKCVQLVAYVRFFLKANIISETGTQRDGIHFQGIPCNNSTEIEQINSSKKNQVNAKIQEKHESSAYTKEVVAQLNDIAKSLQNIQSTKSLNDSHLLNLIIIMFISMLCLLIIILLYVVTNWSTIKKVLRCDKQNNANNCEVEMNTNLL